jgi:hypothetical protein
MHQPGGTLHKESRIHAVHPHRLTLKKLANVSPGLRFGNPGFKSASKRFFATLKELRWLVNRPMATQPLQGCVFVK